VVLLGLGLGFFQQASGSEATVYYTPELMDAVGVKSMSKRSLVSTAD
jgi:hypothetical protein